MKRLVAVVCLLCVFASLSFAKISKGEERYGLGFNAQTDVTAVSLRYWKKGEIGFEGFLGWYSFENSTDGTLIGAKLLIPVKSKLEKSLTPYWYVMLALRNKSEGGASASGTLLGGGLGVEFFFDELPNLGFGAEVGLQNAGGDAYAGAKGTAIVGNSVGNVGIRYYFK